MAMIHSFSSKTVTVKIDKDQQVISEFPKAFVFVPLDKSMPEISFTLDCDFHLYQINKQQVLTSLCLWIKYELGVHKQLAYAKESSFIQLFKMANIINLPSALQKITDACTQSSFGSYPRFLNFLSGLQLSTDLVALSALKARFFWFLLTYKDKVDAEWSIEDLYKLAYYYDWVWLISIYQSVNPPIVEIKEKQ